MRELLGAAQCRRCRRLADEPQVHLTPAQARLKLIISRLTGAEKQMKRFWKTVGVEGRPEGNFAVLLDKRTLKTPGGVPLLVPKERLPVALCIADEWENQKSVLKPHTLPMVGRTHFYRCGARLTVVSQTSIAARAIDGLNNESTRKDVVAYLLRYLDTDTVCFHEEFPQRLVKLQEAHWKPLIDWVEKTYDVKVNLYEGILNTKQPDATILKLGSVVSDYDAYKLAAFERAVLASKSYLIALGLVEGFLSADEAAKAAHVEVQSQIDRWGEVEDSEYAQIVPWLARTSNGNSPSPLSLSATDSTSSTPPHAWRRRSLEGLDLLEGLAEDFDSIGIGRGKLGSPVLRSDRAEPQLEDIAVTGTGTEGLKPEVDHKGHIEYKLKLLPTSLHRMAKLRTQLKWRLIEGGGVAVYELGLLDDGTLVGLNQVDMEESLRTLGQMLAGLGGGRVQITRVVRLGGNRTAEEQAQLRRDKRDARRARREAAQMSATLAKARGEELSSSPKPTSPIAIGLTKPSRPHRTIHTDYPTPIQPRTKPPKPPKPPRRTAEARAEREAAKEKEQERLASVAPETPFKPVLLKEGDEEVRYVVEAVVRKASRGDGRRGRRRSSHNEEFALGFLNPDGDDESSDVLGSPADDLVDDSETVGDGDEGWSYLDFDLAQLSSSVKSSAAPFSCR
ncbi:hypothetical protein RTG_01486 [Rhodotorula toruloides ATCC 204091]|uniref:Uncharacterized protein n=1 Tax=Rhodotorula toruloides TaxID=5286 RepID=A0A0K3CH53_RHOTO|nr:hypothetical protein RTG_01486 [Rhodotorula toruloides ATCC 204091]